MAARTRTKTSTKRQTEKANKSARRGKQSRKSSDLVESTSLMETSPQVNENRRSVLPFVIGFIVLLSLLYYFRGAFVAALVNGQPITRLKVVQDLEKQSGQQALDDIITRTLIEQEAKKKGISVSSDDVSAEISKIEESFNTEDGQSLDDLLAAQGMTRDDLNDRIRFQKLVEKLLSGDVEITDEDVKKYIEENKAFFPEGTTEDAMKETATEQLKQQKLNDKFQELLGNLRNSAKIRYFVNYN